jgi:GDSL-like Lipase/Acylhydrolase family
MQATNGSGVSFRVRGRLIGCVSALALVVSALVFAPVAANAAAPPTKAYLALGDSISFGYTQERFNIHYPNESPSFFEEGFTNYFTTDLHKATEVGKEIRLVNDGCPGETSNGLIGENPSLGGGTSTENEKGLKDWHPCSYHNQNGLPLHNSLAGISQLEDALSILTSNNPYTGKPNDVQAVTIDIGSNDELAAIKKCEKEVEAEWIEISKGEKASSQYGGSTPEESAKNCIGITALNVTFPHIIKNIEDIINVIGPSGPGKYKGPIVVLGYYNPDGFVLPGSDVLQQDLNTAVKAAMAAAPFNTDVTVANPFPKFNHNGTENAAEFSATGSICKYTEMCNPNVQTGKPPAGFNGDIHPSLLGYKWLAKIVNEETLKNPAYPAP